MKRPTYRRVILLLWGIWACVAISFATRSFQEDRTFYAETEQEVLENAKQYRNRQWCERLVQNNLREVEKYKTRTFFHDYLKTFKKRETDEQWYAQRQAQHETVARQLGNPDWCEEKARHLESITQTYREMGIWRPFAEATALLVILGGAPWFLHGVVLLIFTVVWRPLKMKREGRTKRSTTISHRASASRKV